MRLRHGDFRFNYTFCNIRVCSHRFPTVYSLLNLSCCRRCPRSPQAKRGSRVPFRERARFLWTYVQIVMGGLGLAMYFISFEYIHDVLICATSFRINANPFQNDIPLLPFDARTCYFLGGFLPSISQLFLESFSHTCRLFLSSRRFPFCPFPL